MVTYPIPELYTPAAIGTNEAILIASGDLRLAANQTCWPAQAAMEAALGAALKAEGWEIKRAHALDTSKKHGFIDSQRMGIEVFRGVDPEAPLIVAEAVWQYSHHVLAGLTTHRGPILTVLILRRICLDESRCVFSSPCR